MSSGLWLRSCVSVLIAVALLSSHAVAGEDRLLPPGQQSVVSSDARATEYDLTAAMPIDSGSVEYRAENPRQGLTVRFSKRGFEVRARGDSSGAVLLAQRFVGWGRVGALIPADGSDIGIQGARIEYRRGALTEWYVNEPRGIEQGFTIAEPPSRGDRGSPIEIRLEVGSDLSDIEVTESGGLRVRDKSGRARLWYGGLCAWDASGRVLPAAMRGEVGKLSITVDDDGATYPIVVDPIIALQEQKLLAFDGPYYNEQFGSSVAMSGTSAIVGAPLARTPMGSDQGYAFVFTHNGSKWAREARLTVGGPDPARYLGQVVSISGDTAVVAASSKNPPHKRVAHVFVRNGTTWTLQATVEGVGLVADDYFATAVSIHGDTLAVGAPYADAPSLETGVVYIFARNGTTWSEQAQLTLPQPNLRTHLGSSVSIHGDTVVAGADGEGPGGAAYVFHRTGTTWTSQARLVSASGSIRLGKSIALEGDAVVVGSQKGAWVFERNGSVWTEISMLVPSDTPVGPRFGYSVSVSDDTILVGDRSRDLGSAMSVGAAYLFQRLDSGWHEQAILRPAAGMEYDYFGSSVAHSGNWVVVGASHDDSIRAPDAGAAYMCWMCRDAWANVGSGLAGQPGIPALVGCGQISAGSDLTVYLKGAKRLAPAALVVGSSALNMPFRGGTLVPNHDVLFLPLMVNGSQKIRLEETLSVGFPAGTTLYAQFWIQDPAGVAGFSASNAIRQTAP